MLHHISATMLVRRCLRRWPCLPSPLSWSNDTPFRLVVVPCQYLARPSPSFKPISPSLLSHISSVAVPHLLCRHIHPCCTASPPTCSSASVFTSELFCHPYYPASPTHLHFCPPAYLLRYLLHYLTLSHVLCRRCLSTLSDRIFLSLCVNMYYTAISALLHTNFLILLSDLLTMVLFSFLERLSFLSVVFSLCFDMPHFSSTWLHSALIQSHHSPWIYLLQYSYSIYNMLNYDCYAHALICLLQSALSVRSYLLCLSFLWTF